MSRPRKILLGLGIGVVGLIVVVFTAVFAIAPTDWFRDYVKEKIITSTESSMGGKVELSSFSFDPAHLRAIVTGFVIHGNEPAGAAPFFRVARLELDLRLFTSIHHLLDIRYLGADHPEANIIVLPDGRTNIPTPQQRATGKPPLETVVDLAIDHFNLENGFVAVASQKQELNLRGNNLRAEFWYDMMKQGYHGDVSFDPLYIASGRNTPVDFNIKLPLALEKDRIDVHQAQITTPASALVIEASIENLRDPKVSAHINGHLAVADLKNAANLPVAIDARGIPSSVDLDGNATIASNVIQVTGLRMGIGQSNLEASGTLKGPGGSALEFKSRLSLDELARLAKLTEEPRGTVLLNGTATLDASNNYHVKGNVQAENVSFKQGIQRFSGVNLYSAFDVVPNDVSLEGMKLRAFGGELTGNASLQDASKYRLDAQLKSLDTRTVAAAFGEKQLPYDGIISGPIEAAGDLKSPGMRSLTGAAKLSISPGPHGVPVSGRLNASYSGATNGVRVENSFIALPHSRLELSGELGRQLNLALTSTNLNDLLAAASPSSKPDVALNGGQLTFTGAVLGSVASPHIGGHLAVSRFTVEGRQFDQLSADATAGASGANISNISLTRGSMQIQGSSSVGLKNWKAPPSAPLSLNATIQNGDLADLMALADQNPSGYSGTLSANVRIGGTIGNPVGSATLVATKGTLDGVAFDRVGAQVDLSDQLITVSNASLESGASRINLTARFEHPRDSMTTGRLQAHVDATPTDLSQIPQLQKERPNTGGTVQGNGDLVATLSKEKVGNEEQTKFDIVSVNADVSARGLRSEGQTYGDATLSARTSGNTVQYNLTSNFAGSNIHATGNTQLTADYPTTADATLSNLPVERVLVLAHQTDIPATGMLSGTAHFSGTTTNPQGNVDLDLAKAVVYDEPIDHVHARLTYLEKSIDVPQLQIAAGPSHIDLSAHYDHPTGDLESGNLQFHVSSSKLDLARIKNIEERRPGMGGTLELAANGDADIHKTGTRVVLRTVNADVHARNLSVQKKNFGNIDLTANTAANGVNFALDSNLAGSAIHGSGIAQLTPDYPIDAKLTFSNVTWNRFYDLLGSPSGEPPSFDAVAEGQVQVRGPVMNTDALAGTVELTKLQATNISRTARPGNATFIQNQGPVVVALDHGVVRIQQAHLSGQQTDLEASGTVPLNGQPMALALNGSMNLAVLQNFDQDITSSGSVLLATTVRGTTSNPAMNGRIEIHNGAVNYATISNGIYNANGTIQFNGNSASLRNLTAESGGGKVTLSGFFAMTGYKFGLRANASNVRVIVQQGVSVVTDSNINITGSTKASVVSGTVTIDSVTYAPQADLGSMLTRAAPPIQSPSTPSPLLDNMKIDIRVRSSPALAVQAAVAQNIQADADLRIRGTAANPGVLGRVNITEGQLAFFGATYTVNNGSIAFYNPIRISPVLDMSLETQAQGVKVVLRVTGPIDNMKLTYTSDPPLQFQEIVSLLAAGKTPTSDPALLANQPSQPPQGFQQMGESALMSQAIADPVANRLQRVFGVTQLKINPTFTSGSQLPQASVSLQQRVSDNITFTYVTSLNSANAQTIDVEVTLSPQWSATATRDYNGIFSINLLYKRQIR